MKTVKNRQTVVVFKDFANSIEWYEDLQLEFNPDEVIVRDVCYGGENANFTVHCLTTPFIRSRNNILCVFNGSVSVASPQATFNIEEGVDIVNGSQKFELKLLFNDRLNIGTLTGAIAVHLEFVEYIKERESKQPQRGQGTFPFEDPRVSVHSTTIKENEELIANQPERIFDMSDMTDPKKKEQEQVMEDEDEPLKVEVGEQPQGQE